MECANDYNEQALLTMVAQGNELAFLKLFNHNKGKVYTVLLSITHSSVHAEELLQDVFIVLWKRRDRLSQIACFQSYLFIITRNKAYKALRQIAQERLTSRELQPEELHHNDVMETIFASEERQLLQQAVSSLSPQQQQVYQLVKIDGLSREQSAHVLQIKPETVKAHLAKAVKLVRAYCRAGLRLFTL
ncbi:sigma-70 family RNA polymerase sigma factor [Chitinophaga polysaccharea]|uniref:RNA polymerase sigma factor n=1 Tax=Chitinophaga TaxID=79328 RepID=UPI001455446C|nr:MULTISPECIES: sigma-70 family RNA polymerase sigma factor [Chitinophaga]NLR59275.1 sigma-70 family RNA polymerase sigma factor [Chitinophaga polysaccharea]NLU91957.1 sigma-70 family RNA polymerase sigma factor [Chitinophaga sp. Ak27]